MDLSLRLKRKSMVGLIALLATFQGSTVNASEPQDELKSAIVLSFLRYSEWPAGTPAANPITIGVFGRPSFYKVLRRVLDGKSVGNRPIRIVEITAVTDPLCCQVIYLATDKASEISKTLLFSRVSRALTIGETDRFLEAGGAVRLAMVDGHMTFQVDLDTVDRSGIVISSKLLRYGEIKSRSRS